MHLPWTFGTLGSSLPMAIGAKVAFLDRQVVALCGDGALMFTLPELATAVQARANIVIVVCNDPFMRRVFELTGLLDVLHIMPSRGGAVMRTKDFMEAS